MKIKSSLLIMTHHHFIKVVNAPIENHIILPNDTLTEVEFILEKCGCKRHLKGVHENPSELYFNQTTCGSDSFYRGPHQKIIGFSFYGDINSDKNKMNNTISILQLPFYMILIETISGLI